MELNKRPIGVFDSGLGGLTCMRELMRVMPHEDIVYLGDTGRVPYGTRSNETIVKYTLQDIAFLICRGGWPIAVELPEEAALEQAFDYYDAVTKEDIINAQNYKISKVNCIEAIGGKDGSILDRVPNCSWTL